MCAQLLLRHTKMISVCRLAFVLQIMYQSVMENYVLHTETLQSLHNKFENYVKYAWTNSTFR